MATTTRTPKPSRQPDLLTGFDSLTLDPSPRLRRKRRELSRQNQATFQDAWITVGEVLYEVMVRLTRLIRTDRKSSAR